MSRLAAIVESADDAIVSKSLEGIIQSWNKGAENIYGFTAAEAIGQSIKIIIPPEHRDEPHHFTKNIIAHKSVDHYQTQCIRKDGKRIDVSLTMSPILDSSGKLVGVSAITRDITNEKLLEQQLRQSQKMDAVGKLAGGIAHDFNNLLTVINGYAEISIKLLPAENQARAKLEEILKAGSRAAALTSQLLNFSRQQIIETKVVNMNVLVQEASTMLKRLIGEDVELFVLSAQNLGMVCLDPSQIGQLIMNLSINARDAMPQGGKLFIETANIVLEEEYVRKHPHAKVGDYVMLTVTDTGSGMTPEIKARIFEPFFTTKEQGKGTGLGLATCYGIVKQNEGFIDVYSEVGSGTTFKVYFPRTNQVATQQPKKNEVDLKGTETILLVEDEESVRNLANAILTKNGYTVLAATHGENALQLISSHKANKIHLLLTDVVMPGGGGRDLFKKIQPLCPDIKAIYMSGYTEQVVLRHEIQNRNVNFLQKPFTVNGLLQKVRQVLDSQ